MSNATQLARYKKLLSFIDNNFKEDINIEKVEAVCHYSYRNINRIFEALHHETIGKYIKRLRLEKAAQYLKYTRLGVSDIAYEVGFEDRAAFSKAFKKKYAASPSAFRSSSELDMETVKQFLLKEEGVEREELQFEIEFLPAFEYIFLAYRGAYEDILAIQETGQQSYNYVEEKGLLTDRSIFMTQIVDDSEISDSIHLRYNLAFVLEKSLSFELEGLFRIGKHTEQRYAKFIHQGSFESTFDFYEKIYAYWMLDVGLELKDLPTLEFYPNYDELILPEELITEIYIPVE
jgi:AraC family transcriptional regulator